MVVKSGFKSFTSDNCFNIHSNPYKPIVFFVGHWANSADRDQNAASDQGLHCLLTECNIKI